ncbi:MAG: glycosyltransferase family 39 protein [Chloroflexi bacterium]|nr:glycosyltransferase family 39 protein [Chloroflexota bacterium]
MATAVVGDTQSDTQRPAARSSFKAFPLLIVAAIAVVAAALRFYRIDAQSLWYDEGISAHQLTRSFPEIVRAAAMDTHPPGYYWTLKAWAEVFGASELGLRSLSAVWGVAMVALTFLIARRLFGTLAASLAALLLAVAPLAVYYSQEVRMYAQVTALGLLAVYAYTRRADWLYALAGIATLYSQYLGIALLAAVNLHALITWRSRTRREWISWLLANAVIALAFLPWLPTFVEQQSHALNTSPRTAIGLALATLTAYGGGVASSQLLLSGGALLVLLALGGILITLVARDRPQDNLLLAALIWLLPMALVIGLGFRSGLFEIRYLVVGLPGLLMLAGLGIVLVAHWPALAPVLLAIAIVPAYFGLSAQYFDPSLARDDYRGMVAAIERDAQPGDAIVLVAPNQTEIFNYYYHGNLPTIGLPAERPIDANDTLQRLDAMRSQYGRIWLVLWAAADADPKGVIADWLATNGFQATHQWYGSVQLELVGLPSAAITTEKVDAALDNGIVLDAYRIGSRTLRPGDTLDLQLVWRDANGPTAARWKVFTHLLDAKSVVVAQRDAEPSDNLRPTTGWQRGEQIEDNYGIAIPQDLPAGSYTLEVGMYVGDTRSMFDGKTDHLVLGQVEVTPAEGGVSRSH